MQLLRVNSCTEGGQNPQGSLNAASQSQQLYRGRAESTKSTDAASQSQQLYRGRAESTGSTECSFSESTVVQREDRIHGVH